ncbi:MAG: VCBS repeat-containing protein [Deltaproteobacteria bacterium]|nr:VCBS repeat-containing protein [Deltaproteobacteria bacterium]
MFDRKIYYFVLLAALATFWGSLSSPAWARQTVRASLSSAGVEGNGDSSYPRLTADGRYVVFTSAATNLVPNDLNGNTDIFRYDLLTRKITRVSVSDSEAEANNLSDRAIISDDGRYVAFHTLATNLPALPATDTDGVTDVYIRDLTSGTTTRISHGFGGVEPDQLCWVPGLSGDGRYVTFNSVATNLIDGGSNGQFHDYLVDRLNAGNVLLSRNSAGEEGDGVTLHAFNPSMPSADGRYVAFASLATNLAPDDTNAAWDVFVRDVVSGQTTRVSTAADGTEGDASSSEPFMSPDARYVVFHSSASNLVAGDTNATVDVFRKDRTTGNLDRASLAADGTEPDQACYHASLTADGRYAAFYSGATNLVPGDTNAVTDVFLKDLTTGAVTRASVNNNYTQGTGASAYGFISANSTYVAFTSAATDLVGNDTNGFDDVFVNGPFLEDATNNSNLDFRTGLTNAFQVTTLSHQTGVSSARSAPIGNSASSLMWCTVTGPGVISFWWKVSSQAGADKLYFLDNLGATSVGDISGTVNWTHQTMSVEAGSHLLIWAYIKDAAGAAGSDAGWVDNIQWSPSTRRTMYRAYNATLQYHFFTIKQAEFNNAVAAGYQDESGDPAKLFYVSQEQAPGTVALHRLYNPNSGRHYYTKNNGERDALVAAGWNFERDEGYIFTAADVAPADTVEVFRLYHPTIGTHLYTKNAFEAAWVVTNLPPWEQQTSLGWAYNSLTVGARVAAENTVSPDSSLLRAAAGQMGVDLASLAAWQALLGDQTGAKTGATSTSAADSAPNRAAWLAGELGLGGEAAPLALRDPTAAGRVQAWRDFDGDGADDLVWADPATGRVTLTLMGATGPGKVIGLGDLADRNWVIFDVADVNGDGGPDIVWWNPGTREAAFWLLTGATVTAQPVVGCAPEGASLAGVGDFDGDGRLDIAWREAGGAVRVVPAFQGLGN